MKPARVLLVLVVIAACNGADSTGERVTVTGYVHAGPMCAVETVPPDPDCADRPVGGAVILVQNSAGVTIAEPRTAADGFFSVSLPPGAYTFIPQPVDGLMGVAAEQTVSVAAGLETLDFAYDTGIR